MKLTPVVAVPAKNEAKRISGLIEALAAQTWLAEARQELQVVLLVNNSVDDTLQIARSAAANAPGVQLVAAEATFPPSLAHIGSARRLAMDLALQTLRCPTRGVIFSTDADVRPGPGWISGTLAAIAQGADVVGGAIIGDPLEEARLGEAFLERARLRKKYDRLADRLASLIDPDPDDPWPRNHDHTGASLAVRACQFARAGGVPALPVREDLALVAALRRNGCALRHPRDVWVMASSRLEGRAAGGMSACLRSWLAASRNDDPLLVEPPERLAQRLRRRALVRQLPDFSPAARADACWRASVAREDAEILISRGANSHALVEILAPEPADPVETECAFRATRHLRRMIADLEGEPVEQDG